MFGGGLKSCVYFILLFTLQFHLDFSAEVFSLSDLLVSLLESRWRGPLCRIPQPRRCCHAGSGSLSLWVAVPASWASPHCPACPSILSRCEDQRCLQPCKMLPGGGGPAETLCRRCVQEGWKPRCAAGSCFLVPSPHSTARAPGHTVVTRSTKMLGSEVDP